MRDLNIEELGHVYGAGSDPQPCHGREPCHAHGSKSKSKSKEKHASKSKSKSKSYKC
jgi:hypothetical protein